MMYRMNFVQQTICNQPMLLVVVLVLIKWVIDVYCDRRKGGACDSEKHDKT
jgi:hypothetical protein